MWAWSKLSLERLGEASSCGASSVMLGGTVISEKQCKALKGLEYVKVKSDFEALIPVQGRYELEDVKNGYSRSVGRRCQ